MEGQTNSNRSPVLTPTDCADNTEFQGTDDILDLTSICSQFQMIFAGINMYYVKILN